MAGTAGVSLFAITITPLVVASWVSAPVVFLGALALGRWLKKSHRVPLGLFYQFLCLALAIYIPLLVTYRADHPAEQAEGAARTWEDDAINHFGATVIL